MPDGGLSERDDARRVANERRAESAGLADPAAGFFARDVLAADASSYERALAASLLEGARERAARADLGSKARRVGTSLSKFELLRSVLPSLSRFEPLRFAGDLDTSERNELRLIAIAEFIRRKPSALGGIVRGDTVAGQVSGVRAVVTEHLGRPILDASGGLVLRRVLRQMRREDGPAADRAYSAPLLARHLDALARDDVVFDISSPGWAIARYALLRVCHQCLMRGGEAGTLPGQPWRPLYGICLADVRWRGPDGAALLEPDPDTGILHLVVLVRVRAIKDTAARHKKVPNAIASKRPAADGEGDPTCPYWALLRHYRQRLAEVPPDQRATAPLFVGPDGERAVDTAVVHTAVVSAVTALGIDPEDFEASAPRRGGATDLRDKLGSAAGKHLIVQRGRWCDTDIDEIYSRATLGEHVRGPRSREELREVPKAPKPDRKFIHRYI